jgi:hypothetical protein
MKPQLAVTLIVIAVEAVSLKTLRKCTTNRMSQLHEAEFFLKT